MNPILLQAMAYGGVMLCFLAIISFLLRGFFWKYIKVRSSQGRKVLVKVRSDLRNYFEVGRVEDGYLIYKQNKQDVRINVSGHDKFYYFSMGVRWCDVDEEKNALCVNYEAVSGHDAKKVDGLLTRAMMNPIIGMDYAKFTLIVVCVIAFLVILLILLTYKNGQAITLLQQSVEAWRSTTGTVVGSNVIG